MSGQKEQDRKEKGVVRKIRESLWPEKQTAVLKMFEEVKGCIDQAMSPYIEVKIKKPSDVTMEEFCSLREDKEFLDELSDFAKEWIKRRKAKGAERSSEGS